MVGKETAYSWPLGRVWSFVLKGRWIPCHCVTAGEAGEKIHLAGPFLEADLNSTEEGRCRPEAPVSRELGN